MGDHQGEGILGETRSPLGFVGFYRLISKLNFTVWFLSQPGGDTGGEEGPLGMFSAFPPPDWIVIIFPPGKKETEGGNVSLEEEDSSPKLFQRNSFRRWK